MSYLNNSWLNDIYAFCFVSNREKHSSFLHLEASKSKHYLMFSCNRDVPEVRNLFNAVFFKYLEVIVVLVNSFFKFGDYVWVLVHHLLIRSLRQLGECAIVLSYYWCGSSTIIDQRNFSEMITRIKSSHIFIFKPSTIHRSYFYNTISFSNKIHGIAFFLFSCSLLDENLLWSF